MVDKSLIRLPESRDVDRVVPPIGMPASLTIFAAAAMSFLAVFALALLFATDRVADRWSDELGQSATLRITSPAGDLETQVERALTILAQTPGVATARSLGEDEVSGLLAPWLGADLPLEGLRLPRLIELTEEDRGYDAEGLRLRLQAEVPGAVLDDHTRWRRPLVEAAGRLRLIGMGALLLIAGSLAAMVTLAVSAALSANSQVISVLRLIGARDVFVTRAFTRRFTIWVLLGAMAGVVLGALCVIAIPQANLFTDLGFVGGEWAALLAIPILAAAVGYLATRQVARIRLQETR